MREAPSSPPVPDGSREQQGTAAEAAPRRFFAVAIIDNFPILRRYLGHNGQVSAVDAVATRIAAVAPAVALAVVGRDRIELTSAIETHAAAEALLARIEAACTQPFLLAGTEHRVELLLGASTVAAAEFDELRLVEDAEHALEDARTERQPVVRTLSITGTVDRIALKRDLGAAITDESLFVQYQPKINLRRQDVTGVEALLRWRHPTRGLVMPGDFIPIAEESRDIVGMTLWTLRRVIEDQRQLRAMGHDHIVFVNVAGVLLGDTRFVEAVSALVPSSGARIGFEITETSVIRDPESAITHLKMFDAMGIVVAIDDYGAGLSSLAYLKKLPARELKIDKLFITHLTSSNRDPLIVRSTIDLAHALDMEVVAEGVETASTLALLTVMGCDMAQGFLISRPIGFDALVSFLEAYTPAIHEAPIQFARLAAGYLGR